MPRAVGLHIGRGRAAAVKAEWSRRGLAVTGYATCDVGATDADAVDQGQLLRLLGDVGWKHEPVAVSMPSSSVALQQFSIPFTDDASIAAVVPAEAEDRLPFEREDAVVDFVPLRREAESTDLAVLAVRRDALRTRLRQWEQEGFVPTSVGAEPVALLAALSVTGGRQKGDVVVLEIAADHITLVLLADGAPVALRCFRVGTRADGGTARDVPGIARRMAAELERTLLAHGRLSSPLILLTGPEAASWRVPLTDASNMTVDVLRFDQEAEFALPLPEGLAEGGMVALGLSLSLLRPGLPSVDFLRGEFRSRPRIAPLLGPLSFALAAWACLAGVASAAMEMRARDQARLAAEARVRLEAVWEAVGDGGARPGDLLLWLDRETRRAEGLAAATGGGEGFSALRTLRDILSAIPPDMGAEVKSVDISPGRVSLAMAAGSHSDAARLAAAMEACSGFPCSARNLRYEGGRSLFDLEATAASE